jgi:hypothetical protein
MSDPCGGLAIGVSGSMQIIRSRAESDISLTAIDRVDGLIRQRTAEDAGRDELPAERCEREVPS